MNVLYAFPHPLGGAGIGTVAWHHVDALARAGARVTVVTTRVAKPFDPDLAVRTVSVLGPVRPRMVGVHRARRLVDAMTAYRVRRDRPDVVHLWPGAVLRAAATARRLGIPTAREAPSPYTRVAAAQAAEAWADLGLSVPSGHFHRLPEDRLRAEDEEFRAVDLVLVGSPEAADSFASAPFPVELAVARYGFDPALFRAGPPRSGPRTVAFVGRLEPSKGLHVLLRAWSRAHVPEGSRMLLAGRMSTEMRTALGDHLLAPGVAECGWVPDVADFLNAADVMALPSFSEGSALVTYEALGAGAVPLVSTAAGSPIVHGVDGLVHSTGDVDALADHLKRVLGDDAEWHRLRENGRTSSGTWTWHRSGERLLMTYADLVASGAPRQAVRHNT